MHFTKINNQKDAENFLLNEIQTATKLYNKVIWFVSGGSNAALTASVFSQLTPFNLQKLRIMMVDERFGKIGHPDSNYNQLERAGVDFNKVDHRAVLVSDENDLETACSRYELEVSMAFDESDYVIGQLGIGADGHTAGILPNSPAVKEETKLVTSYKGSDFERITLSFVALRKISRALVFALGEYKKEALINLKDKDLTLDVEPDQIFKQLPDVYIINDIIGDNT